MLYMTVWAIRQGACVNNFAHDFAEINIEVKHLLEDIPQNSVLFVGAHGTQNRADYKAVFFAGICATVERLHPKILLIYGSVDKRILSLCIKNDITLVQYLSQCSLAHKS